MILLPVPIFLSVAPENKKPLYTEILTLSSSILASQKIDFKSENSSWIQKKPDSFDYPQNFILQSYYSKTKETSFVLIHQDTCLFRGLWTVNTSSLDWTVPQPKDQSIIRIHERSEPIFEQLAIHFLFQKKMMIQYPHPLCGKGSDVSIPRAHFVVNLQIKYFKDWSVKMKGISGILGNQTPQPSEYKASTLDLALEPFSQHLATLIRPLVPPTIRILKRDGRHLVLDRGQALGLRIGTRLRSSNGAEITVLKYLGTDGKLWDTSLGYLRKENLSGPVTINDVLTLEP